MSGEIPQIWKESIVCPVPKNQTIIILIIFVQYHYFAQPPKYVKLLSTKKFFLTSKNTEFYLIVSMAFA